MESIAVRIALAFVVLTALGRVSGILVLKLWRQRRYAREAVAYPTSWRDLCTVPEPFPLAAMTSWLATSSPAT